MAARARLSSPTSVPVTFQPQRELCLELKDNHQVQYSAIDFFGVRTRYRDPAPVAARLAEQFEQQNRALLSRMDVQIGRSYDGSNVLLNIEAGNTVGAIPLFSPTSAVPDYGLTIQPRFPWAGIGPMLAEMGLARCSCAPEAAALAKVRTEDSRLGSFLHDSEQAEGLAGCSDSAI